MGRTQKSELKFAKIKGELKLFFFNYIQTESKTKHRIQITKKMSRSQSLFKIIEQLVYLFAVSWIVLILVLFKACYDQRPFTTFEYCTEFVLNPKPFFKNVAPLFGTLYAIAWALRAQERRNGMHLREATQSKQQYYRWGTSENWSCSASWLLW